VSLIDGATQKIDLAAYVLTDWPVLQALMRAADRGVRVRIYLDGSELPKDEAQAPFRELVDTPGVEIRVKRGGAFMHLKSYQIDGRLLRTGAANFSASGEKQQDNDLIIIDSPETVAGFEKAFETMFANGEPK
jgi:phosphatidylserine/phosphatidylglycerophosphate/cardiolipin synthase-like enzyme